VLAVAFEGRVNPATEVVFPVTAEVPVFLFTGPTHKHWTLLKALLIAYDMKGVKWIETVLERTWILLAG